MITLLILLLVHATYIWVFFFAHIPFVVNHTLTQRQQRGYNNIASFLQGNAQFTRYFCEVCAWHDLYILVTAPICCDQKSQTTCVQSFTLCGNKQQYRSPDEITLLLLVRATWVLFFVHIPFVVNRTFFI